MVSIYLLERDGRRKAVEFTDREASLCATVEHLSHYEGSPTLIVDISTDVLLEVKRHCQACTCQEDYSRRIEFTEISMDMAKLANAADFLGCDALISAIVNFIARRLHGKTTLQMENVFT